MFESKNQKWTSRNQENQNQANRGRNENWGHTSHNKNRMYSQILDVCWVWSPLGWMMSCLLIAELPVPVIAVIIRPVNYTALNYQLNVSHVH